MTRFFRWHKLVLGLLLSAVLSGPAACADFLCDSDPIIYSFTADNMTINSGDTVVLSWTTKAPYGCALWGSNTTVSHHLLYTGDAIDAFPLILTETTVLALQCVSDCDDTTQLLTVTVN